MLPSLQLNYKFSDKSQLRASYFSSISRPNYYELVPYVNDSFNGNPEMGNPALKHATADNFDLRYELYPHQDEEILISGFYKILYDPIELSISDFSGGGDIVVEPENVAPKATIEGVELVYTKYFGRLGLSVNYAYTYSNVKVSKPVADTVSATNQTVFKLESRTLQGQKPNVLNASLLYRDKDHGIFVQLAYQYLSTTLSQLYADYGFDYYTKPQSFLALSCEKSLGKHFVIFGKFNNLLNTPTTIEINGLTIGQNIYKANYNVGLRFTR
jgi:outer membrane receptor protein involved in Fe transport